MKESWPKNQIIKIVVGAVLFVLFLPCILSAIDDALLNAHFLLFYGTTPQRHVMNRDGHEVYLTGQGRLIAVKRIGYIPYRSFRL